MIRWLPRNACLLLALLGSSFLLAAAQTAKDASDEPLLVVQNGRYGYIDHTGRFVIQPQYHWADDFEDGMATVYLCGRAVSIDRRGSVWPLRLGPADALVAKKSGGKAGFLDSTGRWVIPPQFEDALPFSDGLAAIKVGGKWGFIDSSGHQVLPPQYDGAFYFNQGVGTVELGNKFQLIDKAGQVLTRGLDLANPPSEGLIAVSKGDKWGFVGADGQFVVPPQFEGADSFSEGLAPVRQGDKFGYIDHSGHMTIPLEFDSAGEFRHGLAPAQQGHRSGFIDKSGKFVFELDFEFATAFLFGDAARFWTRDDHRFGYVLTSGKVIWGPVHGSPDHPPLFGWTEEDKAKSCEGVSDFLRQRIASFPPIPRD